MSRSDMLDFSLQLLQTIEFATRTRYLVVVVFDSMVAGWEQGGACVMVMRLRGLCIART